MLTNLESPVFLLHYIKHFPVSCLNRGENGAPKDVDISSVIRSRFSSQCIKKVWRDKLFCSILDDSLANQSTRLIGYKIKEVIEKFGYSDKITQKAAEVMTAELMHGICEMKKEDKLVAKNIIPFNRADFEKILDFVNSFFEDKTEEDVVKILKKAEKNGIPECKNLKLDWSVSMDSAYFGRMLAKDDTVRVPAAVYVSHAIGTHQAKREYDDFTATDSIIGIGGTSGAAHIDNQTFDTAVMYQCVVIDIGILRNNLKDVENADELIKEYTKELIALIALESPAGKQNTMLAKPTPAAFLVEIQKSRTVNDYSGAFVNPVKGSNIVHDSVKRLSEHCAEQNAMFGSRKGVMERLWLTTEKDITLPESTSVESLDELIDKVSEYL